MPGRDDRTRAGKPGAPELETEDLYSVEYLADVASGSAREERLEELKRRIALGAYRPDPDAIAEGMLSRAGLGRDDAPADGEVELLDREDEPDPDDESDAWQDEPEDDEL